MADTGTAGDDVLKLLEGAIVGFATGKGVSLSPDQIGKLVTDCAAWVAKAVTTKVTDKAAADGQAAADKITTLEQAEAAQEKL
jgi:hypothetical protein